MDKRQRGFTLLELLAVLIILAVIALITIPLIWGVLENAKKHAFVDTGYGIIAALEGYYAVDVGEESLKHEITFIYDKNKLVSIRPSSQRPLTFKGEIPLKGILKLDPKGKTAIAIYNGKWCVSKPYEVDKLSISKGKCKSLDDTPPVLEMTPQLVTSNQISVLLKGMDEESDIQGYQIKLNDGAWSKLSMETFYTFSNLNHHTTYKVTARAINYTDLVTEVKLDLTTNEITIPKYTVKPEGWAKSKIVTIDYGKPNSAYQYFYTKKLSDPWSKATAQQEVSFTQNGQVTARVTDGVNEIVASTLLVTGIDTTAPTMEVTGNTTTWVTSITLVVHATDTESGLSPLAYSFDNGVTWQKEASKTFTSNQTVKIKVRDQVGNESSKQVVIDHISTAIPTNVTLTLKESASNYLKVEAAASEPQMGIRGYQFKINNGSWSAEQTSPSYTFSSLRMNTQFPIVVKAIGQNGLATESVVYQFKTALLSPPTISVSPTGWTASKTATIQYGTRKPGYIFSYSTNGGASWTIADASSKSLTFTSDATLVAKIQDGVNEASSSNVVITGFDKTPPTGEIIFSGSLGSNGWYRSSISVSSRTADSESGVASAILSHTNISSETVGTTVTLTITDKAGNKTVVTKNAKIDMTAPRGGDITLSGTQGQRGWYISTVHAYAKGGEVDLSGICGRTLSKDVVNTPTNVSGTEINLTITDCAGNQAVVTKKVYMDNVKPSTGTIAVSGSLGSGGYYNSGVSFYAPNVLDWESGVYQSTISPTSIYSDTSGKTVTLTVTDLAGNVSTTSIYVRVDTTKPMINSYSPSSTTIYLNGNYGTSVYFSCNASDYASGVQSCSASPSMDYISYPGSFYVTFTATDRAGNKTTSNRLYWAVKR